MRENIFVVEWSPQAQKQFERVRDKKLKSRILDIIEKEIAVNPLIGKPLSLVLKGVRSYRVGRLRILYKPYKARLLIAILSVDHRKNVYRKK